MGLIDSIKRSRKYFPVGKWGSALWIICLIIVIASALAVIGLVCAIIVWIIWNIFWLLIGLFWLAGLLFTNKR